MEKKPKPTLLQIIRTLWRARKLALARQMLADLVNAKDPEIYKEIRDCAEVMAKGMCMRWLDQRSINHCIKCPNTAPLLKIEGVYLCAGHAKKAPTALEVVKNG